MAVTRSPTGLWRGRFGLVFLITTGILLIVPLMQYSLGIKPLFIFTEVRQPIVLPVIVEGDRKWSSRTWYCPGTSQQWAPDNRRTRLARVGVQ